MKMNNKGFSMVEILAVVVILGIVSIIGIASVSKLIDNSRKNYYLTQEKQLVLAAQSYANDNKNILPKTIGAMNTITLKELRDNNYIKEEIVDQNKNKCYEEKHTEKDKDGNEIELEGSRVEVYKATKTDYKYVGFLECDACEKKGDTPTSCYTSETKNEPSIKINFPNVTNETPLNENDVVSIEIKGTEENENILVASYSYKIYVNNILKKNSGLKINNKQYLVRINNNKLFNLIPGKIKVVVTATNSDGISKTITSSKDLSNLLPPACGQVAYENTNKMKNYDYSDSSEISCGTEDYPWLNINSTNKARQAWVLCNDNYKLGCAQHEYSVNMTTEGENQDVIIKDKNGNNQTCTIKKCMDYSNPTCTLDVSGTQSSSSKYYYGDKELTISFATKIDNISGIKSYDLTTSSTPSYNKNNSITPSSITQGEKTYYGYVKDNATNNNSCNKKITVTLKHRITFNGNGGTPNEESREQYWGDPIGNLPTATRTGYTLLGWGTSATGTVNVSETTTMPDKDVTYYAIWRKNYVRIYYNANGGILQSSHGAGISISSDGSVLLNGSKLYTQINHNENINTKGLINYNSSDYLNIYKNCQKAKSGNQWNTKTNGTGTNYSHATATYKSTDFCNTDKGDCSVTLYVNWTDNIENARAYYILYRDSTNCNKDNGEYSGDYKDRPHRDYTYHAYECKCKLDTNDKYCGSIEGTPKEENIHEDNKMVIFYFNTDAGSYSCNHKTVDGTAYYINQNVYRVCNEGDFNYDIPTENSIKGYNYNIHGYWFYKGNVGTTTGYYDFQSGWYHNAWKKNLNTRYATGTSVKNDSANRIAACKHACSMKFS